MTDQAKGFQFDDEPEPGEEEDLPRAKPPAPAASPSRATPRAAAPPASSPPRPPPAAPTKPNLQDLGFSDDEDETDDQPKRVEKAPEKKAATSPNKSPSRSPTKASSPTKSSPSKVKKDEGSPSKVKKDEGSPSKVKKDEGRAEQSSAGGGGGSQPGEGKEEAAGASSHRTALQEVGFDDSDEEEAGGVSTQGESEHLDTSTGQRPATEARPAKVRKVYEVDDLPRPIKSEMSAHMTLKSNPGVLFREYDSKVNNQEAEKDLPASYFIRWRARRDEQGNILKDDGGQPILETNSRLVRWSDGSLQLLIGQERFDVGISECDDRFVFAPQKGNSGDGLLTYQGQLKNKMTVMLETVASRVHQERASRIRSSKTQQQKGKKVRLMDKDVDPEKEKEEKIRNSEKLEKAKRKGTRRTGGGLDGRGGRMTADFLESEGNVRAIKEGYRSGALTRAPRRRARDDSDASDDYASDDEPRRKGERSSRRLEARGIGRKRHPDSESEEELDHKDEEDKASEAEDIQEEEEEEEEEEMAHRGSRKRKVLGDDDDDDE